MTDASRKPDFGSNLTALAPPDDSIYTIELMPYQEYSPCQFILQDLNDVESLYFDDSPVFSNIIAISVQNHSAGVTWSADNPAPKQTGTDGIGGAASESAAGHTQSVSYASFIGALLLGLTLWV